MLRTSTAGGTQQEASTPEKVQQRTISSIPLPRHFPTTTTPRLQQNAAPLLTPMRQNRQYRTPPPPPPPQQQQQQKQQQQKVRKNKGKKTVNQQIKSASKELLGETIDEEDMERFDSGFASTQGESIYEELDNPEHYEDLSDFDDPLF